MTPTDLAPAYDQGGGPPPMSVPNPDYCSVRNCFDDPIEDGLCEAHLTERTTDGFGGSFA